MIEILLQGYGTFVFKEGVVYEGEWCRDMRHGWGRMKYEDNSFYEGEWFNNFRSGQGILNYGEFHYKLSIVCF